MPSNTVDIYFKGHDSNLTNTIREVKAALTTLRNERINIKVDVDDRALTRLQDKINGVRNGIARVNVAANTNEISRVRRELAELRDRTVRVDVELRNAGALAELAAFDTARGNVTMNLDLDTRGAAAELAAFIAIIPRSVTINLDIDTGAGAARIAALLAAIRALNDAGGGLGNTARGLSRVGSAAGGIAVAKLGVVVPLVSTLASGAVGAGIFGTAAALGAVTAGAGAMAVGFGAAVAAIPIAAAAMSQKVQDHFTFMKNDVVDTMKEIAKPVEQPLVDLATSLGAAFHQIRPSLDVVTAGAARLVNELSGKMPAIAAEVGPAMEKMFAGAEPHIKNLISNIPSYVKAFGDFAGKLGDPAIVAGAQRVFGAIPGIIDKVGDSLVWAGESFGDLMGWLDAGNLDGFTSGIGDFISNLQSTDWSGVTAGLADMSNAFGDFMGSINTDNLATNIEGLATFAADLTRVSGQVVDAYAQMDEAFRKGNESMGGGPVEWGGKAADWTKSIISELTGGDRPEIPPIPVDITPGEMVNGTYDSQAARAGLEPIEVPTTPGELVPGSYDSQAARAGLPPLEIPTELQAPPPPAPLPPVEQPIVPGPMDAPPPPPPLEQPITPAPMPTPEPPPPVPVDVQVNGAVTVPPPPPVPITFDVTQPTMILTPPPPVPITFDVALPTISIPSPPPVKVVFDVEPPDVSSVNVNLTSQGAAAGQTFANGLAGSAGAVAGAAATMAAAAQGVSVDLSAAGAAAGASFAAGLASQAGAVAAAAANLGAVAAANKGHYKGRKGIAADRIMLIPHGQAMAKGFISGMQSQRRDLIRASQALASDVYTAFDDELVPNIGLSGGVDMTQKVYVTVEAGMMADPVKIGRDIRDALGAYASAVGGSVSVDV
ncbi:hypothetical protein [Rhodococcoides fascians]|uniref:hypothetical protein n=1 Tax=Rhodococcoides fascians TaxID=1828 RepID=UPI00050CC945|nr:hypothetical protein [Rhodococcus fascians]